MRFSGKTSQVKRHFTHSKMVPNGPKNVCSSVIQASWRCSGQMVSELDPGSSGLSSSADQGTAFCSWSLYSHSASLQPANCWDKLTECCAVLICDRLASHPGGISMCNCSLFMLQKTNQLGLKGLTHHITDFKGQYLNMFKHDIFYPVCLELRAL